MQSPRIEMITQKYIIGNWKSNKSILEVENWFKTISQLFTTVDLQNSNIEIVICPPFVFLPLASELIQKNKLPIKLGAQNVSPYANGAFTGEISAHILSEWVKYALIGHSERRKNFCEDDIVLTEKIKRVNEEKITPILCIPDEFTLIPLGLDIVAYEPIWAIGSGKTDSPENADKVAKKIKENKNITKVIYGGSVTPENVTQFLEKDNIDGVLPGGASLDPVKFWEIIINASRK